jgi:hypothetical protein
MTKAKPFPFVLACDIKVEPKVFLIDGFLGRDEQSAIYGGPGSGKSTVAVYAACCVASGLALCGRAVTPGPVLYVAAERGALIRKRIRAWRVEYNIDDLPLAVVDNAVDLRTGRVDADRIVATAAAVEAQTGAPVAWIIFDTVNRVLAGGDENAPRDMGALIGNVDLIFRATGAHCTLIHHVPLDRTDRMRGHGSLAGALDTTISVKVKDGKVTVAVDKANDLAQRPAMTFTFKNVEIAGTSGAPVAVPDGSSSAPIASPPRTKRSETIIAQALKKTIEEHGIEAPESSDIPKGVRVAMVDDVRKSAYAMGISSPRASERAKQLAFQRGLSSMVEHRKAIVRDVFAWMPSGS